MDADAFIARWTDREGGAERANYQLFLSELCDVLGVDRPQPSSATVAHNDYVFERAVRPRDSAETSAPKRIDLYKKGCFILEAKQSRLPGKKNAIPGRQNPGQGALALDEPEQLGRRGTAKGWDVMMQNARRQGEGYVFLLETDQPTPPFLVVCDVGHCLELYADFTGTGRAYAQFPDRKGFRVFLEDLRDDAVRERLKAIWTDPLSLDPTRHAAAVTRDIARRLAEVSKRLEARGCNAEDVAHFLMRCLFTMFAEDVELLPKDSFKTLLAESIEDPAHFAFRLKALWKQMDDGDDYSFVIKARVKKFNGGLFKSTTAFDLEAQEIGELHAAAARRWTEVDPAIFGTLLEQALDKTERRKLGAHYTPRAYVRRLVDATIMEPLRADWQAALTKAEQAKEDGDETKAVAAVRGFHRRLCATRVLDPACGTGNFLYVALELMKTLEGEVLETLAKLGEPESMGLDRDSVDPHRFLGLEINPRAAAIAELVIWIGYLQQHYRTRTGHPSEPILRDFRNINFGRRGGYDAVLTWDGYPVPEVVEKDGKRVAAYPNARRPDWPEAEFIVGNPPFIGGKDIRSRLAPGYAEALWAAHPHMNESADFVMYWWDRAAEILTRKGTPLRRFGLVTTNSISQVFQRRVMERHLNGKAPLSLVFAVPDHPWTKATKEAAAVRIGMTVAEAGARDGVLREVLSEAGLDTDEPTLAFAARAGRINSDLSVGIDVGRARPLQANQGIASRGVQLMSAGFIVTPAEAAHLGLGKRPGLERHIRPYRNGRDLTARSRDALVIDLFGLTVEEVRRDFPEVYQRVLERVKPERDANNRASYRRNWWIFGEPRRELRPAIANLPRYIVTVETMRHRLFLFHDAEVVPDNKLICIADADAFTAAVLSSRIHQRWAIITGGWLGVGNDPVYVKSACFDPFPFPDPPEALKAKLREAGEALDAHRKRVLAEHPDLTLTGLYNVLEKIKSVIASAREATQGPRGAVSPDGSGGPGLLRSARNDGTAVLTDKEEDIKTRGLVLILKELHDEIDRLTARAYGWPVDLSDEEILARLVALNAERAKEEAAGLVRWLRPDYQVPRFGKQIAARTGELDLPEIAAAEAGLPPFPADRDEHPLAVERALRAAGRPMTAAEIARGFKRGDKRVERRVAQVLGTLVRYGRVSAAGDRYAA